jgi:SAM-dependent methyltransferase
MSDVSSSRLFQSTIEYYARCRPSYGEDIITRMIEACTSLPHIAYDLGCGTGGIALPLSKWVEKVYAIDPEPAMLDKARHRASERNLKNIVFLKCRAEDLPAELAAPQLVTMGQSFHWMDQRKVLQILADKMDVDGTIAIITRDPLGCGGMESKASAKPQWMITLRQILEEWCGQPSWKAPPGWEPFETTIKESGLWSFEKIIYPEIYKRTADEVIGLCLSFSWCSPEKLGDRQATFESNMRSRLLSVQPDNCFVQETGWDLLILRRKTLTALG